MARVSPRRRHRRRRRRRWPHPICDHYGRYLDETATPFPWLCLGAASLVASGLTVDPVVNQLQTAVANSTSAAEAVTRRLQSVAAWRPQLEAYAAIGVENRTVCEAGFNAVCRHWAITIDYPTALRP
tara:strand:- start:2956 stop:3336 length:381 start_codon:yes stop_codon:yes gene_type:complete